MLATVVHNFFLCCTVAYFTNSSLFLADFIIFSDSMSSLEAISGFKLEIDIVQNVIKDYTHLANSGKTIILCWIPSHVNIRGNERADTAAKSALSLPIANMKLPTRVRWRGEGASVMLTRMVNFMDEGISTNFSKKHLQLLLVLYVKNRKKT